VRLVSLTSCFNSPELIHDEIRSHLVIVEGLASIYSVRKTGRQTFTPPCTDKVLAESPINSKG